SMGLDGFDQLEPSMLVRRVQVHQTLTYGELYGWLRPQQVLQDPPTSWRRDWSRDRADSFAARQNKSSASRAGSASSGPADRACVTRAGPDRFPLGRRR